MSGLHSSLQILFDRFQHQSCRSLMFATEIGRRVPRVRILGMSDVTSTLHGRTNKIRYIPMRDRPVRLDAGSPPPYWVAHGIVISNRPSTEHGQIDHERYDLWIRRRFLPFFPLDPDWIPIYQKVSHGHEARTFKKASHVCRRWKNFSGASCALAVRS